MKVVCNRWHFDGLRYVCLDCGLAKTFAPSDYRDMIVRILDCVKNTIASRAAAPEEKP